MVRGNGLYLDNPLLSSPGTAFQRFNRLYEDQPHYHRVFQNPSVIRPCSYRPDKSKLAAILFGINSIASMFTVYHENQ